MDEEGLDVAILFRTFPLHCDDSLEAEYANDLCRAWNDWMADFCKADPKRLRPSALITLHDVDLAVDEDAPGGHRTRRDRPVPGAGTDQRTPHS